MPLKSLVLEPTRNARAPEDHVNKRILQTTISGISLVLGLGTRMMDPFMFVLDYTTLKNTALYHK